MRNYWLASAAAAIFAVSSAAHAQTNLEKLGQMKTTGVTEFTVVDQSGSRAESIRNMLQRINLPSGFKIDL